MDVDYCAFEVTVIPAHKKLVKFHQVMLDFSDLTEKLESNTQILNQTLRQISALENALMFHGAVRNKGNDKIYLKTFINKIQIWPIFGLLEFVTFGVFSYLINSK